MSIILIIENLFFRCIHLINKEEIEKFAILIVIESDTIGFDNIGHLEARASLLSRKFTGTPVQTSKIRDKLDGLCILEPRKPPIITKQGRQALFDECNRSIVLDMLGISMNDLGDQFKGYGTFMSNLSKGKRELKSSNINLNEFRSILREIYLEISRKEHGFAGLLPIDEIKDALHQKIDISNELIDEMILELEKNREIDLQVAYDSSEVKRPEMGIKVPGRGLIYLLKYRK